MSIITVVAGVGAANRRDWVGSPGNHELVVVANVIHFFWAGDVELVEIEPETADRHHLEAHVSLDVPVLADVWVRFDYGQLT